MDEAANAKTQDPDIHKLKTHPAPFQAVVDGHKRFELGGAA